MDRVEDILRGQSSEIEPSTALGARLSHVSPGRGSRGPPGVKKKKDQTLSSTHITYERERGQPKGPKKHKNKAISNSTAEVEGSLVSDEYIPTARPLLLVDPKGHLFLPDLTGPGVEELDSIDRVRNGEPFRRSSPLFEHDESFKFLNLGTILTAQNTRLNFKDLVTLQSYHPVVDDQACISLLSRGESNLNDIGSQLGSKCQRCQKSSKRCLSEMQLSTAVPAMNNIFVASQICTDNLRLLLHDYLAFIDIWN
ncbi:MAG: hypothetical protein NXY57DRAFT_968403 [Lentinula lateritia]|nr:MAG: hypothetical protein NXY57DRAFT_968403 [Lentinula lateritia]